jgi:hypothetical protein
VDAMTYFFTGNRDFIPANRKFYGGAFQREPEMRRLHPLLQALAGARTG